MFRRYLLIPALCAASLAQWPAWLPHGAPGPTAAAPRASDGHPDLSGVWDKLRTPYHVNVAADLAPGYLKPWAAAVLAERQANFGKDRPSVVCLPWGPKLMISFMAKIVQTPQLIVILHDDLSHRQIFMDGRPLPASPNPSWFGYSIGRWDGDTLVVETTGYNDRTWLDIIGHPHTEQLRTTERYRRIDSGHLELEVTFDDPGAYAAPWTVKVPMELTPGEDLIEYICNENERDRAHMVGAAANYPQ